MIAGISVVLTTFVVNARRIDHLSGELRRVSEEISIVHKGDAMVRADVAGTKDYLGKRIDEVNRRIDTAISMIQLRQKRAKAPQRGNLL